MNVEPAHSPATKPSRSPPSSAGRRPGDDQFAKWLERSREHARIQPERVEHPVCPPRGGSESKVSFHACTPEALGLDARASIGLADLGHVHLTDSKEALARSPAKPEEDLPALLEPLEFCLAVPTGTGASMMPAAAVPAATAGTTLPLAWPLMERLVRRLALGGDGRSGTARIEIGAGELTGATLLLTAEAGTVDVAVELPAGAAPGDWEVRLRDRLARSGVPVGSISVR